MKTLRTSLSSRVRVAAFDPAVPEDHALIEAKPLRDQFNSLKALIDAVPVVNSAVVGGVQTVEPWTPADVTVGLNGGVMTFSFAIPRGYDGSPGAPGEPGPQGVQGPPFAQATVDSVQTLPAGSQAWVSSYFDGNVVHLSFGIPEGTQGGTGPEGPPGPPGEVTTAQLNSAVQNAENGSSANSNAVQTLPFQADEYYDAAKFQATIDKINELLTVMRR